MAKETILVVDGDTRSRKILEVSFKKSGYRVLMTESIAEAIETLKRETPDLIVSDTQLPDGDGFSFCKKVKEHSNWEHVPFLFLTEESSLPRKIKGLEIGADDYLTRPIYIKEVTTRAEVLLQKRDRKLLSEGRVEEFEGELSEITLIDLVQTIDEEDRTGVIELRRGGRDGLIAFQDGDIVDASCGKLQGAAAVYRLMLWPAGDFVVKYRDDVRTGDHIQMSTDDLLLEGIHRLQQWDDLVDDLPELDHIFETDYQALPGLLDEVPEQVGRIIRLFDGYRTVREVIDDSPVGDVTAARVILRIFDEGVLRDVTDEVDRDASASAETRSHLADWLERSERAAEESTNPGYPGARPEDDPNETQEIEHDDLATALSRELGDGSGEKPQEQEQEVERSGSGGHSAPGPRYMPADGSGSGESRRPEPASSSDAELAAEDPASVDETLKELEEAERLRRHEEAKRLVEQQHGADETEDVPRSESGEQVADPRHPSGETEGVPRIPGATKTRHGEGQPESPPAEESSSESEESAPADSTASGEWMAGLEGEQPEEAAPRKRDNTPRARPTVDSASPWGDGAEDEETTLQGFARSEREDDADVRPPESDAASDEEAPGVPVSFETVEGEESAGADEEEEDVRTSAERRAVSVDEAESVKDEASEAVRESARKALEEAAAAMEQQDEQEDVEEEEAEESGRSRKETMPFGQSPDRGQPAADVEVDEAVDTDELPGEKVERIATNGELVRTEYDLSDDKQEEQQPEQSGSPSREETQKIEVAETDPGERAEGSERSERATEKLPSAKAEEKRQQEETQGEASAGDAEVEGGLAWDDEPTARHIEPSGEPEEPEESAEGEVEATAEDSPQEESDETDESAKAAEPEEPEEVEEPEEPDEPAESAESEEDEETEAAEETTTATSDSTGEWAGGAHGQEQEAEGLVDRQADDDEEESEETDEEDSSEAASRAFFDDEESDSEEESADADEDSPVEALSDNSRETAFFADQEEEEYDWDFDEDYEESGGQRWPYVVFLVVVLGVGAAWAMKVGPFATSTEGGSGDGSGEEIASAEEPTDEKPSAATVGASDDEEPTEQTDEAPKVEPPKAFGQKEATPRAEKMASAVNVTAQRTATSLNPLAAPEKKGEKKEGASEKGDGTDSPEEKPGEKASAKSEEAEASESSSSQESSSGGGLGGQIARARQLIQAGKYSQAKQALRGLREKAPNSASVAKLYLDLASGLQINEQISQAKQAYRSYLDMQPDGSRASEVRSILDRL